jgi:hypothetical protein
MSELDNAERVVGDGADIKPEARPFAKRLRAIDLGNWDDYDLQFHVHDCGSFCFKELRFFIGKTRFFSDWVTSRE